MCSQCKSARRRGAAVLALAPALSLAQPVMTGMTDGLFAAKRPVLENMLGVTAAQAAEANASADQGPVKYTCPMHPHYIADEFGSCPICGMDLVKLETGNANLGSTAGESRTAVTISAETIQNMGVRLGRAEQSTFGRRIRSYGTVEENQRQQTEITARVEGWVEDLQVKAVGDEVKKGDLLFRLYSPQLIISQNDYLRSRGTGNLAGSGEGQLRAFGVQPQALEEIRQQERPMELVPFYAEQDGTISELSLREGTYVTRGMMLAKIQDYSTVWLMVAVSEKDLGFIGKETPASVTFPNLPGREVKGAVDYVYPTIDPQTRTGQVRLVIENRSGQIRPGSYADVVFEVDAERRVAVPSEAVLKSGAGAYVVVSLGEGRFEPRLIETGLAAGGWTEVKSGVIENEDVVVSGQFLLDSESALRESFRKLERLQVPLSLLKPSANEFAMIDHVVDAALYIHEALVDGYDIEPSQLDAAISIKDLLWPRYKDTQLSFVLQDSTAALVEAQQAKTVSELQTALAKLVGSLRSWIVKGAPEHYAERKVSIHRATDVDRHWLQIAGKPLNPYGNGPSELVKFASEPVETADSQPTVSPPEPMGEGTHREQ